MTKLSAEAAASRALSTADRLAEVRARLDRLGRGEPTTSEDVQRARLRAQTQARAVATAQERLLLTHRAAVARHEAHAEKFAIVGRAEAAERERTAARRVRDTIERLLGAATVETPGYPSPAGSTAWPADDECPEGSGEADAVGARSRQALAALLAWSGAPTLAEVDRRQAWCRSIVRQSEAPGWRGWLHAVCLVAASAVTAVRGVAITVFSGSGTELTAASDGWTAEMQEMELIVGEGPSRTAHADSRIVVVDDFATEREAWQGYASAVWGHDIRGVVALPLYVAGVCVGALTFYGSASVTKHDAPNLKDAAAFADIATAALTVDLETVRHGRPAADERFLVHVATGVMAARLNISTSAAESRLRARAFSTGMSLQEVAQHVLMERTAFA